MLKWNFPCLLNFFKNCFVLLKLWFYQWKETCYIYLGESKVFRYFGSKRHNSAVTFDAFAEVMKVTIHTLQWDPKLTWSSPSVTCQICFCASAVFCSLEKKSTLLGLLLRFLRPKQNFFNHLVILLSLHLFQNKCLWLFPHCDGQVWTCKAETIFNYLVILL